jgi:twitching motility protein PilT
MLTLEVPSIEQMELPQICKDLILQPRGLTLVTGPTGVGKSTTMAAMIRRLNENRDCKFICIEDPLSTSIRKSCPSLRSGNLEMIQTLSVWI